MLPDVSPHEYEKWEAEKAFREREIAVQEREQTNREAELEIKRSEQASSGWRNPLVITIIAATLAAFGNAGVTLLNGNHQRSLEKENGERQRQLERDKSEQTRILEMIKTGDPDKAAENLRFLLDAGLINEVEQQKKLQNFLTNREPGSGPSLPSQTAFPQSIIGLDDAVKVETLTGENGLRKAAAAVGRIELISEGVGQTANCTAFLVSNDIALTSGICISGMKSAKLFMFEGNEEIAYQINLPPLELVNETGENSMDYALVQVNGNPGSIHGTLRLSRQSPKDDQQLAMIMFRGNNQKLAIPATTECRVRGIERNVFNHFCDTGGGSAGAPVLTADGKQVLGVHYRRSAQGGGIAVRADVLLNSSKILSSNE